MKTTTYKFQLDKSSKKFRCPSCGKKRFVKFIDVETESYIDGKFGRCDREINCGYFHSPYEDSDFEISPAKREGKLESDTIPYEVFRSSLKGYAGNRFIQYLKTIFDEATVSNLIEKYHIGTSKHWPGSTVFWQIDHEGTIRTGKVMLYDETGHRVKKPFNHINWVHSILYDTYNLKQCLFGEHLVKGNSQPIGMVESEKTAIIAAGYFPEFTWLATGALHNLKPELCSSLIGKDIILFPDLGATRKWRDKAEELAYFCNVEVSTILEEIADHKERKQGYDLADYLTESDTDTTANPTHAPDGDRPNTGKYESQNGYSSVKGYPASWDEITPPDPGTIEYKEATRQALSDCDSTYEKLKLLDTKVALIEQLFDATPENEVSLKTACSDHIRN